MGLPILLIVLDGLGDRQHAALESRTPLEAAATPNLDALAAAGATGLMWPLGPGRAPSSPLAHTVLFGFTPAEYPGRGLVEAIGEGLPPGPGEIVVRANFVRAEERDGALNIAARPDPREGEDENVDVDLGGRIDGCDFRFVHTGAKQGLLFMRAAEALSAEVTDADPLRAGVPVPAVVPYAEAGDPAAAARTARALNAWMRESRARLAGRPLDMALVKWAALQHDVPSFERRTGLRGATTARGPLYRGIAEAFGMTPLELPKPAVAADELDFGLSRALSAVRSGDFDFVHVHTKAPDQAGHRKDPAHKRDVIEVLDAALAPHLGALLGGDIVVCVTADHQTPSSGPLYHAGGAVPLLVTGGATGRDDVGAFGETACRSGALGHLRGSDLMPLLLDCAERSAFLGVERYTALPCLGVPSASDVELLEP